MSTSRTVRDLAQLEPGQVCLIKPSALGDVVHALPVLSALRGRWPDARFSWVINRGLIGLVEGHPDLDEVIPFDRSRAGVGPRGLGVSSRFLIGLRRRRFDLAIDLQGLFRSGLMAFATGAPVRVGRADAREGAGWTYTHRIGSRAEHAVDRLLDVASAFGADVARPRFSLPIREEDRRWAREAVGDLPRPLMVINPGARWVTKRWPPRHFAEVARRAITTAGAGVVVVGAPEDRPLAEEIAGRLGAVGLPVRDLTGKTTLSGLAAVASESDLVLSNDTGPLHLAVASGARVIAVFTCTDPAKTGPYGPGSTVIRAGVWCAGSCIRTCDRMECMVELSPDRVWPAVAEALKGTPRRVA
ncbi:glycosyltransferase family 9 protein [Tautonia plasticadhaerens]|uniref:ADP-heptose--LPS heptosyltransferase 2 n=1 Tax=Tautonia plasticadhaerens TaxID=2527974 RepID=A0A518H864_9BACT|nr:glycosyltransferase family 9 protein [Tautonia plasticadhaerens]QDV37058.1 ADP-heptose--LPS heptosyltransferase 2 [Tautonia plasticadhaerens]